MGAGIIGTAAAYYLARDGWNVTLVDRAGLGEACSHANCGLVCPSHVLPLAEPGAVAKTLPALLQPNAPLAIQPRLDWDLWAWLLAFARRCNRRDMLASARAIQPLLDSSLRLFETLFTEEGIDCEWQKRGLLFAYRDAGEWSAYDATDRLLRERFAAGAQRLAADELADVEPALTSDLAGGWHYDHDGHLRPDKLLTGWRSVLERQGVRIIENCPVRGFVSRGGQAVAARVEGGEIPGDVFVAALGAWSPEFARGLGCRIPIQPGKGYSITLPSPTDGPRMPLIFPETHVAVTPMVSGLRLGSMMEFAGYDDSLPPHRLRMLRDGAQPYLRTRLDAPAETPWYGWRPMTTDGLPIIDRAPRLPNVMLAAGHNMLGLSMAPATGRLVTELLGGASPHVDPRPYRVSRF